MSVSGSDIEYLVEKAVAKALKNGSNAKGDSPHHEDAPHYLGSWQAFCPECENDADAANPNFKDETHCVDCGAHLGAKAAVNKLKRCPFCGGHHAEPL
jgi:hypothetical protein